MKSAALLLALAGVVAYAMMFARPLKHAEAGIPLSGGSARSDGRPNSSPQASTSASAPSPYWRLERRYVRQQHQLGRLGAEVRRLRRERAARTLQTVGGSTYAIRLAASAFRVSEGEMRAVADCETGGTFSPTATNQNSGAAGLFQFLSGTWAREGLAGFSVYDPVANALAAARLVVKDGSWRQWSCRP